MVTTPRNWLCLALAGLLVGIALSCSRSSNQGDRGTLLEQFVRPYVDEHRTDASANMVFSMLTGEQKYLELGESQGDPVSRLYLAAELMGISSKKGVVTDFSRAKLLLDQDETLERSGFVRRALLFKLENPNGHFPIASIAMQPDRNDVYDFYHNEILFAFVDLMIKAKTFNPGTSLWLAAIPGELENFLYETFLDSIENTTLSIKELTAISNHFEANTLQSPRYLWPVVNVDHQVRMLSLYKRTQKKIAELNGIDIKDDNAFQVRFKELAEIVNSNFERSQIYTQAHLNPGTLKSGENQYWKTCLQVRDEMKQAASM